MSGWVRSKPARTMALVLATMLGGCGIKPPAAKLTFKPPDGWHAGPGLGSYSQSWISPNNPRKMLLLYHWGEYVDVEDLPDKMPILFDHVDARRLTRICNQKGFVQEAAVITGTGTWAGIKSNVMMLVTDADSQGYFGIYINPVGYPSNDEAQASLLTMCAIDGK